MNPELQGDSFLIVGFGREGESVYRHIKKTCPGARVGVADRNELPESALLPPGTAIFSGPDYLKQAGDFSTVIRSPGVSIREISPFLTPQHHLTSATNIFFAECPGLTVGITGTKGKSTTSSLTAQILSQTFSDLRLVGNIGRPMLDHLEGATSDTCFVVELSSYQLEDLRYPLDIAILLNIVPEHLNYHGGFEAYCDAKLRIARLQRPEGTLILNPLFPLLQELTSTCVARRRYFCEREQEAASVMVRGGMIEVHDQNTWKPLIGTKDLPLRGSGNLQNVLAAITCANALGVPSDAIKAALAKFKPLEHRLEFVADRYGITFYNDSLSTIPEALAHALEALGDTVETVIAGGFDRGVEMSAVGPALAASQVKNLILFPTTGDLIWDAAISASPDRNFRRIDVHTMRDAVQAAYDHTAPGKICVMSPASSSFSVFRDYRDRGDQFKEAVRTLSPTESATKSG